MQYGILLKCRYIRLSLSMGIASFSIVFSGAFRVLQLTLVKTPLKIMTRSVKVDIFGLSKLGVLLEIRYATVIRYIR